MPRSRPGLPRSATAAALIAGLAAPCVEAVDPALRLYADQLPLLRPLERVRLGTVAELVPLSSLTQEGYASATALEAGTTWTFLAPAGPEIVNQAVPVDPAWSCTVPTGCSGAFGPGVSDVLLATDRLTAAVRGGVAALDWDGIDTLYLRGQVFDEGAIDETRICTGATDVPWLVFPNPDGTRRYLAAGDPAWISAPLLCADGLTQGGPCDSTGTTINLSDGNGTTGTFRGRVAGAGTLTLPSGHVLDALLLEQHASFEGYFPGPSGPCAVAVARLRLYRLLWLVPEVGLVAEVTSPDDTASLDAFVTAEEATIDYGLLPPVSLRVDAVGPDSIAVSWDPGRLGANPPDSWTVHWGTQPGAQVPPPFSATSTSTAYTISGLTTGTRYWVSVSATKSYTDPVSGVDTTYESVALPLSIGADVDGDGTRDTSYPPEVSATPATAVPVNLLRDDTIPPGGRPADLAAHFPLDATMPYLTSIPSGSEDPEAIVLADANRPFVLYAIDPARTIKLTKSAGRVRVDYL